MQPSRRKGPRLHNRGKEGAGIQEAGAGLAGAGTGAEDGSNGEEAAWEADGGHSPMCLLKVPTTIEGTPPLSHSHQKFIISVG